MDSDDVDPSGRLCEVWRFGDCDGESSDHIVGGDREFQLLGGLGIHLVRAVLSVAPNTLCPV